MNNKNKKTQDEQEKLLDHLIEYGGRQYIEEEVQKFENVPELEPSKEFDDKMQAMFKKAYQKEVRKERIQIGKKIAAVIVIVLGIAIVSAMNVKAFREPVLNFIFNHSNSQLNNKTKVALKDDSKAKEEFTFGYMPNGYQLVKENNLHKGSQITYDYKNNKDQYIHIYLQPDQKYDAYQNMDKSSYTKIKNHNKTYYFIKGKSNKFLWYNQTIIFNISSPLSENEMLKIAENIQITK